MKTRDEARTETSEERGVVLYGTTEIRYAITRSARRKKTVAITLDHGGGVMVTAPERTPATEIRGIVLKRADWILRNATEQVLQPRQKEFTSGDSVAYLGRETRLVVKHAGAQRVLVEHDGRDLCISVPARLNGDVRHGAIQAAIVLWYRQKAAEHLPERVERWARIAQLRPGRVLIRDQRTRWGSCSADGTLRFNWRIMMAPPPLIDYLVVHELVHLRIRNHSKAFWAEVAKLLPDYKDRRSALKQIGLTLEI